MAHSDDTHHHTAKQGRWMRGLYMLAFLVFFGLGETVLALGTVVQFLWLVITGQPNQAIARFGRSLAIWTRAVVHFQLCTTDDKPFPWQSWPEADAP